MLPEVNSRMSTKLLIQPKLVASVGALFLAACAANATVIGNLSLTSGTGELTVTATSIVWGTDTSTTPVSNGETTNATTLSFVGGPLATGSAVDMANLTINVIPSTPFMTFPNYPNLVYTLTAEGPGSSNLNCAGLSNTQTCSPFAGDPVVLELLGGTTVASIFLQGTVTDGHGVSTWSGTVTANIVTPLPDGSAPTPGDIQNYFATHPNGSLTLPNTGTFNASAAPEPGSFALMGAGLFLLGAAGKRIRRRA